MQVVKKVANPVENKLLCVSRYTGKQRKEVERLTLLLGGRFTDVFSRSSVDLLICLDEEGPKFTKAVEWGIECHTLDWLHSTALEQGLKLAKDFA